MPNDYFTIKALARELNDTLANGKIDKIYMPEKDEITLAIRSGGVNRLLAISCNPSNPRIHLTAIKKINPTVAPSFCMHLRKHVCGGVVQSVSLLGKDRILDVTIQSRNEMHDVIQVHLIAEMMGRYSNILLTNPAGIITDTLKQVPYDTATKRCLLPSAKYALPAQSKILPDDRAALKECLRAYTGTDLCAYLCARAAGFAPCTAREVVTASGLNVDERSLDEDAISRLIDSIELMLNVNDSSRYAPCVSLNADGDPEDYFVMPYRALQTVRPAATLNEAVDWCVGGKDLRQRQKEHSKFLQKAYRAYVTKTEKKLSKCRERLSEAERMDSYKKMGDLIVSNCYAIKKGDAQAVVPDYSVETCPTITIPLDTRLTPQQNAQAFYKKYAKMKRTAQITSVQIREIQQTLDYLYTIEPSIDLCRTPQEIAEVQQELESLGAMRPQKAGKNKLKPAQPITYEIQDFVVCVGKNNLQNDKLTFKVANGNDVWIHTKGVHGSHVIVFAEGREIPSEVLQKACEICAYYSQGSQNPKVECDYTKRKNLRRHPSGKPGMVLYNEYNTAYVTPDCHAEYRSES